MDSILLKIIGVCSLIIFLLLFIIFIIKFVEIYLDLDREINKIKRTSQKIKKYIGDFGDINQANLQKRADMILENIVKDDLSSLDYDWKKIDFLNFVLAFYIVVISIYILGDDLVVIIKSIASFLGFSSFGIVQQLNLEIVFSIFFPVVILFFKYILVTGLQNRNKLLRRSLVIVTERISESNSFRKSVSEENLNVAITRY